MMDTELIAAYTILALSLVALFLYVGYFVGRYLSTDGGPPARPHVPFSLWPWSLQWMVALTAATGALLVVQVLLGVSIGALSLLADSAHGAADLGSYTLATFVEYFKFRFGSESINSRAAAQLDRASAGFSILVVMATSICVCAEATERLMSHDHVVENGLGSAMMVVAGLGFVMNGTLLALRGWLQQEMEGPAVLAAPPAPEPPAAPIRQSARRQASAAQKAQQKAPRFCVPSKASSGQSLRQSLHAAFHPGCLGHGEDDSCSVQGCSIGHNLNLYGVVLHVGSDVARTLLMFVAGAMVRAGLFKNSAAVDAVCACFIAGMVTLGSVWLLGVACRSVQPADAEAGSFAKGVPPGVPLPYGTA